MTRTARILIAALALLLLVVGSALAGSLPKGDDHRSPVAASHQPQSSDDEERAGTDEADEPDEADEANGAAPSEALIARLVERLAGAGIDTDAETIAGLAATYGVGGAVRVLAWADATGKDPSEITDLFDSGLGWGAIARQLNEENGDWDLTPGIGKIMGHGHGNGQGQGNGLGREGAPGQNR
jgi:hypothetical protein